MIQCVHGLLGPAEISLCLDNPINCLCAWFESLLLFLSKKASLEAQALSVDLFLCD